MNPYDRLFHSMLSAADEAAKSGRLKLRRGKILSTSPLKVEVAGTDQEASRFWVSHRLLKGHSEKYEASGSLSISTSGSHSTMNVNGGTLMLTTSEPVLQQGDNVLLLTDNDQEFYLIDKVVRA